MIRQRNFLILGMMLKKYFSVVFLLVLVFSIVNIWLLGSFNRSNDTPQQTSLFSYTKHKNPSKKSNSFLNDTTSDNIHKDFPQEQNATKGSLGVELPTLLDKNDDSSKETNLVLNISADIQQINAADRNVLQPPPLEDITYLQSTEKYLDIEDFIDVEQESHQGEYNFSSPSTMPPLWGASKGNNHNLDSSPLLDRMELLDSWIKYLSDDSRLEQMESKTLMIYEGGAKRWNGDKNDSAKFCSTKCKYLVGQHGMNNADGILFIRDWFYSSDNVVVPENKLKILSFLESPLASTGVFKHPNTVVASYHRGSDIVIPYGKWVSKPTNKVTEGESRNYAAGKTKMAAAFISNCGATNNRMVYINNLQGFVSVDVYGACGKFRCPRSRSQDCFDKLKKDYKFYLAFENANCRDYITEKLFHNAFQNNVVPIVFGAHPYDYKAMAPPHSYIHIEDFVSVEGLANYLKLLDANDTLYNEYFKWKGTGAFYSPPDYASTLCRMCAMLHYADYTRSGPPLRKQETWSTFDECLPTGHWYWNRDN